MKQLHHVRFHLGAGCLPVDVNKSPVEGTRVAFIGPHRATWELELIQDHQISWTLLKNGDFRRVILPRR